MNKKLVPDLFYTSVFKMDISELKKRNIKGILFDVDNTLAPYGSDSPTEESAKLIERLKKDNFLLGIISNAGGGRSQRYAEKAEMIFPGRANKPSVKIFRKAAELMKLSEKEIAVVGDQIFTDILGGNRFGALTVLIRPCDLKSEPWYTAVKRIPEKRVLRKTGLYEKYFEC